MDSLKRVKQKSKSDGFVLSKAVPIDNRPEKAQANQKAQILKRTINDRYVADNYYQSANMDDVLFEKDGLISRMKQFDYKVHKFIKKRNKWLTYD